ncbi:KPN_02809 family neutral zinc metallopeptidase [Longimicrobium sp.]|uniref:KPN_02809 family neutral zinc metallopeptidase n=1 Tax=Longimicrobium sp. TaxID=2029185 RepID=UPI002B9520C7|nr:neutral zinc metallopeptidase [Longimicrobium sp.]HSU16976.1 neutral zinc metallopeptidase [Longimicrobium sp.]
MRLNTGGSSNVEDRRGMGGGLAAGGGVGAIILGLLYMLLGGNPGDVQQGPQPDSNAGAPTQQNDAASQFVGKVLRSTELTWADLFQKMGRQYQDPRLVLYSGAYPSACGLGQAAMGPFYCPNDQKVYLDMSFFDELDRRFHAPGQFADAYVIAHEVGHHVQNQLGISQQVQQAEQAASSKAEANSYSVRLELQADCFAGVWANQARQRGEIVLEQGDVESALNAASAIGDDKLQQEAQGRVVPESFTHGSSAQRVEWFSRGLQSGDPRQCDTFEGRTG